MTIDPQLFKETMAQWASGVTVLTSVYEGQPVGITASSFASVSLEPPRVLVCVAKRLHTHGVIERSGVFAVNILAADQVEWGMRFAGLMPELGDRFMGIPWTTAVTASPILPEVLGWLDCRLDFAYDGGDHTIFVGRVEAAQARAGAPLLYFSRQWRQLDATALRVP